MFLYQLSFHSYTPKSFFPFLIFPESIFHSQKFFSPFLFFPSPSFLILFTPFSISCLFSFLFPSFPAFSFLLCFPFPFSFNKQNKTKTPSQTQKYQLVPLSWGSRILVALQCKLHGNVTMVGYTKCNKSINHHRN